MSPSAGRFLGRDPIGYEGSAWSLSEFVGGKPFDFVDPDGFSACYTPCVFAGECCRDTVRFDLNLDGNLGNLKNFVKSFGYNELKARFEMQRDSCCEECDCSLARTKQKVNLVFSLEAEFNSWTPPEIYGVKSKGAWYVRAGAAGNVSFEVSRCTGFTGSGCGQISLEAGYEGSAEVGGTLGGGFRAGINVTCSVCAKCSSGHGCGFTAKCCADVRARAWASIKFGRKWQWYRQWHSPQLCTGEVPVFGAGGGGPGGGGPGVL